MRWWHVLGTVSFGFCAVLGASAEDWPQFRGLNRDGKSPETGLLKEWPAEGPQLLWTVGGLGKGYSTVSVSNGLMFTTGMVGEANEGMMTAIDLDGNVKWQIRYGAEWSKMHPGARNVPTVDGDTLYELSGVGILLCIETKTGAIVWSRDIAKEFAGEISPCGFGEAPLVYGNLVICTPGGKDASLAALDKNTGTTVWTTTGFSDQSAFCSPILIERGGLDILVTITGRNVVGLDVESGKVLWLHPFDANQKDPNHAVSPVYQDGMLYVTSGHREGGQMIEIAPDGRQITPRWADTALNTAHGGLVLVEGYIYGSNSKNRWVCLELKTGQVMYETVGVGLGSITYADGMLYCYSDRGTLGLVKATPTAHEVVSRFKITQGDGPDWAHPVISGGRLYIRHGDFLMAYDVAGK